ncbi:hypothetical protein [Actinoplanes sp. TFC3]|uniref:hypothetical protein n=1 Tax=Actinoplanes sp. TFC3 TaxID=1710355 RepID=UPI00137B461B|nr:hypothetical protein [Actinoplanes sp. TFC3]
MAFCSMVIACIGGAVTDSVLPQFVIVAVAAEEAGAAAGSTPSLPHPATNPVTAIMEMLIIPRQAGVIPL